MCACVPAWVEGISKMDHMEGVQNKDSRSIDEGIRGKKTENVELNLSGGIRGGKEGPIKSLPIQ